MFPVLGGLLFGPKNLPISSLGNTGKHCVTRKFPEIYWKDEMGFSLWRRVIMNPRL